MIYLTGQRRGFSKDFLGFQHIRYEFLEVGRSKTISAHIDGWMSNKRAQTGSEDPHRSERKCSLSSLFALYFLSNGLVLGSWNFACGSNSQNITHHTHTPVCCTSVYKEFKKNIMHMTLMRDCDHVKYAQTWKFLLQAKINNLPDSTNFMKDSK